MKEKISFHVLSSVFFWERALMTSQLFYEVTFNVLCMFKQKTYRDFAMLKLLSFFMIKRFKNQIYLHVNISKIKLNVTSKMLILKSKLKTWAKIPKYFQQKLFKFKNIFTF